MIEEETANADPMTRAIWVERKNHTIHPIMIRSLEFLGTRYRALILGDASLVQSDYLLNTANFSEVVNIDNNPALLDDTIIKLSDKRILRVLKNFDDVYINPDMFDYVYGKSIAFNPKKTIGTLLKRIAKGLYPQGIFAAVWATTGDTFRPFHYKEGELRRLYEKSGLEIIRFSEDPLKPVKGLLGKYGVRHEIKIIAKKN